MYMSKHKQRKNKGVTCMTIYEASIAGFFRWAGLGTVGSTKPAWFAATCGFTLQAATSMDPIY